MVFSVSTIGFSLLLATKFKDSVLKSIKELNVVIIVNGTTALMWLSFLYSLKFIPPAVAAAINAGIIPIATYAILKVKDPKCLPARVSLFRYSMLLLAVMGLMVTTIMQSNGVVKLSSYIVGFLCVVISGATTALNNVYIKDLFISGFNAKEVMAIRFYGIIILSSVMLLLSKNSIDYAVALSYELFFAAALGMVLPLYLLQKGIALTKPTDAAVLMALGPVVTYCLQTIVGSYHFYPATFVLIMIAALTAVYESYISLAKR